MPKITYPPRQDFAAYFANLLVSRIPKGASVLDIGSGGSLHPAIQSVRSHFGRLTGVDPGAEVLQNPSLDRAIHSPFESCDFEGELFDAAFAYNVLEHIADPAAFAAKLSRTVKPGGWFWALTPHANHPFARTSRLVEWVGLKPIYRAFIRGEDGYERINDYSSYYRWNSIAAVQPFLAPPHRFFDEAEFMLMDAMWDGYFPSYLRWVPKIYENTVTRMFPQFRLLIVIGVRIASP